MTAFDNIKVNNWPATSNEFEDFLVLKLPLNDNASLTESLPVVAGSQELFPKRTLTNTGVAALESGDEVYARVRATMTNEKNDSVDSLDNLFDGNLSTTCASTNGTDGTITFSPAITGITSLRIHCQGKPGNGYFVVNGTEDYGQSLGDGVYQWVTISNVTSLSTIFIRHITGNTKTTVQAIEVNGTVLVDPAGGLKKHYDNNAVFTAATQPGSGNRLSVDNLDGFSMGANDSWCFEAYINPTQVSDSTLFGVGNSGFAYRIIGGSPYLYIGGTGAILNTGTIPVNTWTHIAVSREVNTLRSFVNGTQVGSNTTNTASWDVTSGTGPGVFIGAANLTNVSPPNYHFDGQIQDLRFYKGTAKYTSNFTPPSAILG